MKLVNTVRFSKKKLCKSILISLLKLMRNISKYHFSGKGALLNSIMDIHCSSAERGALDEFRCEGRGGQNFPLCRGHK